MTVKFRDLTLHYMSSRPCRHHELREYILPSRPMGMAACMRGWCAEFTDGTETNSADAPELSTRRSRSEREFEPPRRVIYPVPRLLAVRVDVREPADATPNDILQVAAVLI